MHTQSVKIRDIFEWGSCGKHHNEPLVYRKLKDISDSHLLHIISWIKLHPLSYRKRILDIMLDEQEHRTIEFIFIPEYS